MSRPIHHIHPFPGLKHFDHTLSDVYVGREAEKSQLLKKLNTENFVAILGASGVGKTSFIESKVIPILKKGYILRGLSEWRIATLRPNKNLIRSLAHALSDISFIKSGIDDKIPPNLTTKFENILYQNKFGILDIFEEYNLLEDKNVLIFIDHFDDIFQSYNSNPEELFTFLNRLEEVISQNAYPVKIITTLRNHRSYEQSSHFAKFAAITEWINKSQFILSALSVQDIISTLEVTSKKGSFVFDPAFYQHVVNYYQNHPLVLGEFQHAMKRTVESWFKKETLDPIRVEDLDDIGGLDDAINFHLNQIYNQLNDKEKLYCKHIFQSLTSISFNGVAMSVPQSIQKISEYTNLHYEVIINVLKLFSDDDCGIILVDLGINDVNKLDKLNHILDQSENQIYEYSEISISQDIVLEKWKLLEEWTREEKENIDVYTGILLSVSSGEALFEGEKLKTILEWHNKVKPHKGWASRNGLNYVIIEDFIEKSKKKNDSYVRISESEEISRQRKSRRTKLMVTSFVTITIFLILVDFIFTERVIRSTIKANEAEKFADLALMDKEKAEALAVKFEEKAEIKEFQAAVDSLKAFKNKIESDRLMKLANQYQLKMREAELSVIKISRKEVELNERLDESMSDISHKKIELEFFDLIGRVNKITKSASDLLNTNISANTKLAANIGDLATGQLELMNDNKFDVLNFKSGSNQFYIEYNLTVNNLTSAIARILNSLEIPLNRELLKIKYGTTLDISKNRKKLLVGTDDRLIFELNIPAEGNIYSSKVSINSLETNFGKVTSGIRALQVIDNNNYYVGTVDGILADKNGILNKKYKINDQIKDLFSLEDNRVLIVKRSGELNVLLSDDVTGKLSEHLSIMLDHQITASDVSIAKLQLVVSGGVNKIDFYELNLNKTLNYAYTLTLDYLNGNVTALKYLESKNWIVVGSDAGNLVVYSLDDENVIFSNNNQHSARITSIAIDPSEKLIVTGGRDSKINVWKIEDLKQDYKPIQFKERFIVEDVEFISDNLFVSVTRGQDNDAMGRFNLGRLSLWSVNLDLLIGSLKGISDQWQIADFASNEEYQKLIGEKLLE